MPRRLIRVLVALLLSLSATARAEDEVPATGGNYGGVGLIEMRNARFPPDGTLEGGAALRHQRRFWFLSFQALPFLEATFRLTERLDGTTGSGMTTDRGFDLKLRLLEEGPWWPAVAIGLQDLIGTGIYAGEYVVASKRWHDFDFTLGMGWGRLGTAGDFDNPLGALSSRFYTRPRDVGAGGTLTGGYFRGREVALFGGVEWSVPPIVTPFGVVEGLRAKVEISGDSLRDERGGFPANISGLRGEASSRVNAGLQWSNEWLDVGVHFVHGTDALFRVSLRLDPAAPPEAPRRPPPPLPARPVATDQAGLAQAVFDALDATGFTPLAFGVAGSEARIAIAGGRTRTLPQTAARVLRAVSGLLPREVEMLRIGWWQAGAEIATVLVPRAVLEGAILRTASPEEAYGATTLLPATGDALPGAVPNRPPYFDWGIEPRLALILGDPSRTVRWQAAVAAGARLELGAGFAIAGSVQQALFGNLEDSLPSDSVLPHVRSDYGLYAREGTTSIPALYAERVWNIAPDVFGRVTAGYLEPMFGGVSGEVLYRPHDAWWAIGADLNWVRQRDYDQRLGFRDYSVTTGHVSFYADLPVWNLYGIVRAGRYLAGDWGATFELGRRFDSGIEVGGFATFTDVSAARFGEGSFDKGIYIRFPLALFGADTASRGTALIRPTQRDGGQRLAVDNPLWEVTREGRADALRRGVAGFAR